MKILRDLLGSGVGKIYTAVSAEVLKDGVVLFRAAYGGMGPNGEINTHPVLTNTLFDLASLTKLFTTTALLRLADSGKIRLDSRVGSVLPAFNGPRAIRPYPNPLAPGEWIGLVPPTDQTFVAGEVTFEHLLTHSSGLPAWLNLREKPTEAERLDVCLFTPFAYPTGLRALYSDIGFILLGKAIERIVGEPLDAAMQAWVMKPLGLSARFGKVEDNVAPTEFCPWRRRRLIGEVHDENCAALGGVAGHAGLFGTASDVAALGQFYLDGGRGLIGHDLVECATTTHIGDRGLGWLKPSGQDSSSGRYFSPESYGHTGFTGTSLWVDPARKLVCALLTNRVFFGRDSTGISAFRRQFHDTVIEGLDYL